MGKQSEYTRLTSSKSIDSLSSLASLGIPEPAPHTPLLPDDADRKDGVQTSSHSQSQSPTDAPSYSHTPHNATQHAAHVNVYTECGRHGDDWLFKDWNSKLSDLGKWLFKRKN